MAGMATMINQPCPECWTEGTLVRDDEDMIVYCSECGAEFHPGDPDYPAED